MIRLQTAGYSEFLGRPTRNSADARGKKHARCILRLLTGLHSPNIPNTSNFLRIKLNLREVRVEELREHFDGLGGPGRLLRDRPVTPAAQTKQTSRNIRQQQDEDSEHKTRAGANMDSAMGDKTNTYQSIDRSTPKTS